MKFHLLAFLISFIVGVTIVYFITPFPDVVVRYPRPYDYQSIRYQKANGICMEYQMKQVSCDANLKIPTIMKAEEKDTRLLQR